jgi:lipopolysaccharide transport system ATP-binding protein
MDGSAIAVSCRGVSKRFPLVDRGSGWRVALGLTAGMPRFTALDDVSFDVPKGQFVGLIGRNGAGKSTMLRILGGIYSPDAGTVAIGGELSGLYELGLAGNPMMSGRAYADRLLAIQGLRREDRTRLVDEIKTFSELGDRFEDPIQTYSAGMSARLFFSAATARKYDVYLIDEILSVGDQHFQAKCWRRLRERVRDGASGVLVTHDWSAVARLCESANLLQSGKIVFAGPADAAVRTYLFGDERRQPSTGGVARFAKEPAVPLRGRQGEDFHITLHVEILEAIPVSCVSLIERFDRGSGWEICLMSRGPTLVGNEPGHYGVDIVIPRLPLEGGHYEFGATLVTPDRDRGGKAVTILDSRSWINGDAWPLDVEAVIDGLDLGERWSVGSAVEGADA